MNSWNDPLILELKFFQRFFPFLVLFAWSKQCVGFLNCFALFFALLFLINFLQFFFFFTCPALRGHTNRLFICLVQSVILLCCYMAISGSLHACSYPSGLPSPLHLSCSPAVPNLTMRDLKIPFMECLLIKL